MRGDDPVPLIRENALSMRRRAILRVYEAQPGHPGGD